MAVYFSLSLKKLQKGGEALASGDLSYHIDTDGMVWDLKKQLVRRAGELANTKLLIPMCITFIGILLMIMIPIFANLGS